MIIGISGKINSGKDTVAQMIRYWEMKDRYGYPNMSFQGFLDSNQSIMEYQSDWRIKRFADTLKDTVCMWLGCTREQLEDREFKEKPLGEEWWYHNADGEMIPYKGYPDSSVPWYGSDNIVKLTPRKLMQLLGTEAGREIIHPNIWVNALFAGYKGVYKCSLDEQQCRETCKGVREKVEECENSKEIGPKWVIPDTRFPNEVQAIRDRSGVLIRVDRYNEQDGSVYGWGNPNANHPSETALDNWEDWDYVIDNNGSLGDLLEKVKVIYEKIHGQNKTA